MLGMCSNGKMNSLWTTAALLSLVPRLSSSSPALTERRGCRPGYSLNSGTDLCELCPSGTFTESYNWDSQCQSCSICNGGRQVVAPCTASSNTLCRCADDHYEHDDGCSPKPRTTQSGIDELSPLLQGFGKQLGTEIQKVQIISDNLTETVGRLQEIVASDSRAQELLQEKVGKIETYALVTMTVAVVAVVAAVVVAFVVSVIFLIQCCAKQPKNGWCFQQCHCCQGNTDRDTKDRTPAKGPVQGANGGAHMGSPKGATTVSTVADHDDSPQPTTLSNIPPASERSSNKQARNVCAVDITPGGKRSPRDGRHESCPKDGIPIHGDPDDVTQELLSEPNCD